MLFFAFALGATSVAIFMYEQQPILKLLPKEAVSSVVNVSPSQTLVLDKTSLDNAEDNTAISQLDTKDQSPDAASDVIEEATSEQIMLYQKLVMNLTNPAGITFEEFMTNVALLSPEQQINLRSLFDQAELNISEFKAPTLKRYQTVDEGAPQPTALQQSQYEDVVNQLYDQTHTEGLSLTKLISTLSAQAQHLPPSLKQTLADQVSEMISNGQILLAEDELIAGNNNATGAAEIKLFIR